VRDEYDTVDNHVPFSCFPRRKNISSIVRGQRSFVIRMLVTVHTNIIKKTEI